ncbi:prolyl oligopeptidase family serine peptidase [Undibacterium arcticum]
MSSRNRLAGRFGRGASPLGLLALVGKVAAAALVAGAAQAGAPTATKLKSAPAAPPTPIIAVSDTYHGITASDPYRWLENAADPKVHQWSLAQDQRTRKYIDRLPSRAPIFKWLMQQAAASSSAYYGLQTAGEQVFAMYNQPPKQQPMIAVMGQDLDPAKVRIVLDPNQISAQGTTAIDWFVPSPTGELVAVSLSDNGSEDGSVHIFFDVKSGQQVDAVIPRVQYPTGGGSLAWRADGSGFWYTQYPGADQPAERQHFFYQQVFYHRIGDDPKQDVYVLGKDFPKVAEIFLDNHPNSTAVLATVANGDGGEFAHYVIQQGGAIRQVTRFEDQVVATVIGPDDALYLVSRKDAPRGKLLKLKSGDYQLAHAQAIVAQSDAVMQSGGNLGSSAIVVTPRAIYLNELVGGPSRVAIYDHDGKPQGMLPLPDVATVNEVEALGNGALVYSIGTYLKPSYFARYDEKSGKGAVTKLVQTSPVNFDDTEVVREFATSKDGTKIPLNIVRRKGVKLDGNNPLLLNGYGGYGVSQTPHFLGAATRLWLDGGGVFVSVNLRGGGEFGEEWHQQGMLTRKQNVFDDFIAAGQYLVQQKYTSRARMASIGGSNGGLLMGGGTDPAAAAVPRRGVAGRPVRYVARRARSEWRIQRD